MLLGIDPRAMPWSRFQGLLAFLRLPRHAPCLDSWGLPLLPSPGPAPCPSPLTGLSLPPPSITPCGCYSPSSLLSLRDGRCLFFSFALLSFHFPQSPFISLHLFVTVLCLCQPQPLLDTPVYFLSSFLCLHLSLSPSVLVGLLSVRLSGCLSLSLLPHPFSPLPLLKVSQLGSWAAGEWGTKCYSGSETW